MLFHQSANSKGNYNYNIRIHTDAVFDYHFHSNMEVVYVLKGCLDCTIDNKKALLKPGDLAMCLSYEIHKYVPVEHAVYWVLVFSDDYVRTFAKQVHNKQGEHFVFRCCSPVEEYIKAQLIYNDNPTVYVLKSCLYAICNEYISQIKLFDKDINKKSLMIQITDYIQTNYQKNIHLSDIAKELGYDYHYLSRYFNSVLKMSFSNFLNFHRLQHAIELLEETGKPITEISLDCGFQSTRSFNHFFKKNNRNYSS